MIETTTKPEWIQTAPTLWVLKKPGARPMAYVRDHGRGSFEWWLAGQCYGAHCNSLVAAKNSAWAHVVV